jgi:hypothetical protein
MFFPKQSKAHNKSSAANQTPRETPEDLAGASMLQNGFRVGISLTPSSIQCVVLSSDYQLLGAASQKLKKGVIDLQKGVLEPTPILKTLKSTLEEAGVRPESYSLCRLHLSLPTPLFSSIAIEKRRDPEDVEKLLAEKIRDLNPQSEKMPLILAEWLGESDDLDVYVTSNLDKMTLRSYLKLFHDEPWSVASVETTPSSVLRSLAGSGVLDTMLNELGNNVPWALLGVYGDKAWLMQWQGKQPLFAQTLLIEGSQADIEKQIHERIAYSGFNPPAMWFTWHAPLAKVLLNLDDISLRAPKIPCRVGPYFASQNPDNPTPPDALGAALFDGIGFPFQWNFFNIAPDMSIIWSAALNQ